MPQGSCTDNCSYSADNPHSFYLLRLHGVNSFAAAVHIHERLDSFALPRELVSKKVVAY
jgi:hypothetical protein